MNFFGNGLKLRYLDIGHPSFEALRKFQNAKQMRWNDILFNFELLNTFGFSSWESIPISKTFEGLIVSDYNKIEIKKGGKFICKFKASDLLGQNTLFPIFNSVAYEHMPEQKNELILVELTTGLISKFKIQSETLTVPDLKFEVLRFKPKPNYCIINKISFQTIELRCIRQDCLIRELYIIE